MKYTLNFFCLFLFVFFDKIFTLQNARPSQYLIAKKLDIEYEQIPVLCYHNIKINPARENLLTISEAHFEAQIKCLHDSGYHAILPEQLYQYLTLSTALPSRPIMISFDDTHEEDFSIAKPILEKYGFKGVFFIMTVCIDKRNYLTAEQIKKLSDQGHVIENHTWDHQRTTLLKGKAWTKEIDHPKAQLEKITGKHVEFFAYPYGIWNETSIAELKKRNIKAAFQLTGKLSHTDPLFTIRRMMVSGLSSPQELEKQMAKTFTKAESPSK